MNLNNIINTIESCNIHILAGSGLSRPYLETLGNIERLLTELEGRTDITEDKKQLIKISLYKKYFDGVMINNLKILESEADSVFVLSQYKNFLKSLNSILLKRKITLLSKEVNIFTTNIDIFFEKALEELSLEYNDGFNGRFLPIFSLSNFKKSHFKRSLHYDNIAELPIFNLLKLHGSLSWMINNKDIVFSTTLKHLKDVLVAQQNVSNCVEVTETSTVDELLAATEGKSVTTHEAAFLASYEENLIIVNPTKEKFKHTLMNQTYYEMLRLYSNELEKENSVLFVMGFSFEDEHIREITLRAMNSNPTLKVYAIAHSSKAKKELESKFDINSVKNNNLEIISPELDPSASKGKVADKYQFDLQTVNSKIFDNLLNQINGNNPESVIEIKEPDEQVI